MTGASLTLEEALRDPLLSLLPWGDLAVGDVVIIVTFNPHEVASDLLKVGDVAIVTHIFELEDEEHGGMLKVVTCDGRTDAVWPEEVIHLTSSVA